MEENNSIKEDANGSEKVSKHMGKSILIAAVMGVIALIYIGMSVFFRYHYFFNTTIAGRDYSLQSRKSIQEQFGEPVDSFTIVLQGRENMTDSIDTENLNLSYVFDDTLQQIDVSQNIFCWPESIFEKKEYDLPVYVSYDKEELKKELMSLSIFSSSACKKAVDAHIGEYDEEKKAYSLVVEDTGTDLQIDKTLECIENAFKTAAFAQEEMVIDLEATNCYRNPSVYSNDESLQQTLNTINRYVSTEITYDWNGQVEIVDGNLIHDWLSTEGNKVLIDAEAVRAYVELLAKRNDTYGKNRSFQTTSGNVLSLRSGAYGWKTDVEAETQALLEEIKKGKTRNKEPVYQSKGYVKGLNDIGSSYVEINLSTQHLFLYEKGIIIFEADFVSGNMANGSTTPAGVFGLTYKTTEATLQGEDYESFVHYWMPFNGNIGMHDATWRTEFGGDIYLTNGSHGCVNLPLESAAFLYNYLREGFPVVCYYE